MIIGMLTAFCLAYFVLAVLVKLWNLWHKGMKLPWWLSILTWGFGLVVLAGLLVGLSSNNALAYEDSIYAADLQESIYYAQFGLVSVLVLTMLTFAEMLFAAGFIATQGFGVASGDEQKGWL